MSYVHFLVPHLPPPTATDIESDFQGRETLAWQIDLLKYIPTILVF